MVKHHTGGSCCPFELPEFVGVRELASCFRVSRRTIYSWIKRKLFPPPRRLAGAPRWTVHDVRMFIKANQQSNSRNGLQRDCPYFSQELPRLLLNTEVAGLLGITSSDVHKLSLEGKLPAPVVIGKCVRWIPEDIYPLVRKQCRKPRTA